MKQLIIFIFITSLLGVVSPDGRRQREIVEHYVTTLLNTEDESIKDVFSLMKIIEEHEERLTNELTDILLSLERQLKRHKCKILTYCQACKKIVDAFGDPSPSRRGDIYYAYDIAEGIIL